MVCRYAHPPKLKFELQVPFPADQINIHIFSALTGDIDRVESIISKARDSRTAVNAPDNSGYTALHYAARNGHTDICRLLLQNGANIDALTKCGKASPLHKAAVGGINLTNFHTIKYNIHIMCL